MLLRGSFSERHGVSLHAEIILEIWEKLKKESLSKDEHAIFDGI